MRTFVASEEYEKTNARFLENVVSLCIDCHRKAEFGKVSASAPWAAIGVGESAEKTSVEGA